MSSLFNGAIYLLALALVAKAITLPLLFFLPVRGIDFIPEHNLNLYRKYPVAKAFGMTQKPSAKKRVKKALPKKPLYRLTNVKLKGVYSENGEGVIAIEERGKIHFLSTGEEFKGYTLIRVQPDKAIFEKDGKEYELKLEEASLKGKYTISLQSEPLPGEAKFAILRREIEHYKRNFGDIWKHIAIQEQLDPRTKRLKGFKVTRIDKGSLFARIGLQKGDLIIGANGKIFRSYSDVVKLYNNIGKYNSLKLMVVRNNEKKELEYEIY